MPDSLSCNLDKKFMIPVSNLTLIFSNLNANTLILFGFPEDISENWPPLKQHSTPQYLERRSRVRKTRNLSGRRAASQDRSFVSLGSWRRKSEPSMIPQYDTKTIPKKISNLKKAKESSAKFYTDFSDSENCDAADDSLETKSEQNTSCIQRDDTYEDIQESSLENDSVATKSTLEQVVSDLLMQNKEFQKVMNRRKNVRDSEPLTNVWLKQENENDLPTKSDSLPRNIQLNDHITSDDKDLNNSNSSADDKGNAVIDEIEEQHVM